jgi:hypothetical protein
MAGLFSKARRRQARLIGKTEDPIHFPPAQPAVICRIQTFFGFSRIYSAFIAKKSRKKPGLN